MALCAAGLITMSPQVAAQNPSAESATSYPGKIGPLRVEIGTGYDFFSYSYTLLNADTASTMSEGNLHLNVLYAPHTNSNRIVEIGDRIFLGREYNYNTLSAYWREGGWQGASATADLRWDSKHFHNGELLFSNDHNAVLGTLRGAYNWSGQWSLRGRLHGEIYDYEHHNTYFYDTRTWGGALTLRGGEWTGPFWEIEAGGSSQTVPDSTLLSRTNQKLRLIAGWGFSSGGELQATLYLEGRDYPDDGPRPDRTLTGLELDGRFAPLQRWGAWLQTRLDNQSYGRQTLIYNNGSDVRIAAGPAWRPSDESEIRLGAGYHYHFSKTYTDTTYMDLFGVTHLTDSYSQPFLFTDAYLISSGGLWMFTTVEAGYRSYKSEIGWDSDFLYVDLGVTAEIPLWKSLALQILTNFTPERHREPEDNSITNYISVDFLYRFH